MESSTEVESGERLLKTEVESRERVLKNLITQRNERYQSLLNLVNRLVQEHISNDTHDEYKSLFEYANAWEEHDIDVTGSRDWSVTGTACYEVSLTITAKNEEEANEIAEEYLSETSLRAPTHFSNVGLDVVSFTTADLMEAEEA